MTVLRRQLQKAAVHTPAAERHVAFLFVEREIADVNLTRALEELRVGKGTRPVVRQ